MGKRKICVVVTARPSYSRIKTALKAIQEHPELVKKYLGTVVPKKDNFYAALNSAVFSGFQNLTDFIQVPIKP